MASYAPYGNADPVENVLSRLSGVRRTRNGWEARCPSHDDRRASLSVGYGDDGRVLLNCFVGCETEKIVSDLGLTMADLFAADERRNGSAARRPARPSSDAAPKKRRREKPSAPEARRIDYEIRDPDGTSVAIHERVEYEDGSKTFYWKRPEGTYGLNGRGVETLPVYGSEFLAALPDGATVVVCEGETATRACRDAGLNAVGTVTGAETAPNVESLRCLERFDVVLWDDNDEPGREHMALVAKPLMDLEVAPRQVVWDEAPPGGDAADVPGGPEQIRALVAAARPYVMKQNMKLTEVTGRTAPTPLYRPLPDPEPFPTEALGPNLAPAARAIERTIRSHPAMIGQAVLTTAALAVQAHANVKLPFGQVVPLSLYAVTVADSGERKTATDREASQGVRAFESVLQDRYRDQLREYGDKHAAWESARTSVLRTKDLSLEARESQLRDLGAPPSKPPTPMVTCPEPTYEGLVALYESGRLSLGLFSSEGGQFVGGFAMSDDQWLKTCAAFSDLWDGGDIRRVRKGDGASVLPGRRLSLHLQVQPTVAPRLLANAEIAGQGFLARLLVAAPPELAGTRTGRRAGEADYAAIEAFSGRIQAVLNKAPTTRTDGGLNPRTLPLTPDADRRWWAFSDYVEGQLGPGEALRPIKAFGAKMAEHAARVGAVLQLIEDVEAPALDTAHLDRGIALVEFYASEWLRLHEAQATSEHLLRADRLRVWLLTEGRGDVIGLPEVYQRGPSAFRDAGTAREAMRTLEDHGWVVPLPDGAVVDGTPRREAWSIVREQP